MVTHMGKGVVLGGHQRHCISTNTSCGLSAYRFRTLNTTLSRLFQNKPNQIHQLGNHISSELHAVGFKKKSIAQSTTTATPWLLSALWLISDFTARTKILLLPIFSATVFMNCITATVIIIAYTQTVLKLVTG